MHMVVHLLIDSNPIPHKDLVQFLPGTQASETVSNTLFSAVEVFNASHIITYVYNITVVPLLRDRT